MTDTRAHSSHEPTLPHAKIRIREMTWQLWLVPAGALALCAWFVCRDFISTGPSIAIYFKNADGLEEKNTQLKYRGAQVGQVRDIKLMPDNQSVKVTVRLSGPARNIARAGSVFWIVRPELNVGNVTGLGTIVSGEYISMQPGNGAKTNGFLGAEKEPVTEAPGALEFTLHAPALSSIQEQTPIFYRGVPVGEVVHFQLSDHAQEVVISARVWAEYGPLVRTDTKFWNAGGLELHVGLFKGLEIKAQSPKTLISGGIEFATPPGLQSPATNGAAFVLYDKAEDKWKSWTQEIPLQLPAEASHTNAAPALKFD